MFKVGNEFEIFVKNIIKQNYVFPFESIFLYNFSKKKNTSQSSYKVI